MGKAQPFLSGTTARTITLRADRRWVSHDERHTIAPVRTSIQPSDSSSCVGWIVSAWQFERKRSGRHPGGSIHRYHRGVTITLAQEIAIDGGGATQDGTDIVIPNGDSYVVQGTPADGMIHFAAPGASVDRVLSGATISITDGSAIYLESTAAVTVSLMDGANNAISDGGTPQGEAVDGLYANGSANPGTLVATVTTESSQQGGFGPPR